MWNQSPGRRQAGGTVPWFCCGVTPTSAVSGPGFLPGLWRLGCGGSRPQQPAPAPYFTYLGGQPGTHTVIQVTHPSSLATCLPAFQARPKAQHTERLALDHVEGREACLPGQAGVRCSFRSSSQAPCSLALLVALPCRRGAQQSQRHRTGAAIGLRIPAIWGGQEVTGGHRPSMQC